MGNLANIYLLYHNSNYIYFDSDEKLTYCFLQSNHKLTKRKIKKKIQHMFYSNF